MAGSSANPLEALQAAGQSIWYDYIRRGELSSGQMQRLIDEDFVTGLTANPTIFDKAISGSSDYDAAIRDLAAKGFAADQMYEQLATDDVRSVADLMRPIYDKTQGADGFVSIEVSPKLAHDRDGSIAEAKRFWTMVGRPNVMIKIPGTVEGYGAIEELLFDGLNVNITLLFSVDAYDAVVDAYISALERRRSDGRPIDRIASVASFFVSRIDTLADKLIDARLDETRDASQETLLRGLLGKVAIANAKIAYEHFLKAFGSDRFASLRQAGARVQRPLWASTSTKSPNYSDVMYAEALIGPDTVDTMPPQTIEAFRDHGKVSRTIDTHLEQAHVVMEDLERAGISMTAITDQVLREGVDSFADSFRDLHQSIQDKVAAIAA
jgi:transaldolase